MPFLLSLLVGLFAFFSPVALASDAASDLIDLTHSSAGFLAIAIFVIAYVLVILEEQLHLAKSKPVLLAAGLIWVIIAISYGNMDKAHLVEHGIRHNFLEYAELFFFLLVAMTYINAMLERGVFDELRNRLVAKGYSLVSKVLSEKKSDNQKSMLKAATDLAKLSQGLLKGEELTAFIKTRYNDLV